MARTKDAAAREGTRSKDRGFIEPTGGLHGGTGNTARWKLC